MRPALADKEVCDVSIAISILWPGAKVAGKAREQNRQSRTVLHTETSHLSKGTCTHESFNRGKKTG